MLSNIVSVFELSMNTRYVPSRRFPGQIVLVQPEEYADDDEWTPEEAFRAWQDHAAQVVRIAVPGNHMSMLESPGIDRVARELWLER
jgi:thioesterase domain-containing protein